MSDDLANLRLSKSGSDRYGAVPPPERGPLPIIAIVAIVLLVLAAGYWYGWRTRPQSNTPAAPAHATGTAKAGQNAVEPVTLPPLADTDPLVRSLVSALSSNPVIAAWLTNNELIINFVTVTSNIADGRRPVAELKAIGPIPPFKPKTSRGSASLDATSFHRYDRYAEAVSALDARGTVRLYETLKPRINEADRTFGGTGEFDKEVEQAIVELLKVPVVEGPIDLQPSGIVYAYTDGRLEGLSPAQKQLLRMGPDNVRAIQAKLREIAALLQIPASRLPPPVTL